MFNGFPVFSGVDQLLSEGTKEEAKPVVNFVFLTRSGNKQQYNSVEMPVDSELVTKLRTREEVLDSLSIEKTMLCY